MALPKRWLLIVLVGLASAVILKDFSATYGFLKIPRFGDRFRDQSLPVVHQYAPPEREGSVGYDGQFYAQIATDPLLRDPKLNDACDHLPYRAKRVGLPWLAYILGLGNNWWVLQIYSILNLGFWLWLAWMLVKQFGAVTYQSQLLLIGILWNAGVLTSMSRALTDLPALTLSIAALIATLESQRCSGNASGGGMARLWFSRFLWGASALTKETSLLSLGSIWRSTPRPWLWNAMLTLLLAVVPLAAWTAYVRWHVGPDQAGLHNFTWPFWGFYEKLGLAWSEAVLSFPRMPILEMVAPLSIAVQVIWMIKEPRWNSSWWCFGLGHCLLAITIGSAVWASQTAYGRCLLPLTVSFNIMLCQSSLTHRQRLSWWWAGNVGFMDRAAIGLVFLGLIYLWKVNKPSLVPIENPTSTSG